MSYSNSRDYSKAAAKRAEWQSYGSQALALHVDTPRAAAEKQEKLVACLQFIAAVRAGMTDEDALDANPKAQFAFDNNLIDATAEELDSLEKQCREKFAIAR